MEKIQIEEIVEKATRNILDGGKCVDFHMQCLGMTDYMEEYTEEDEQNEENGNWSTKYDTIIKPSEYKAERCPFFVRYRCKDLEKICNGILERLQKWANNKQLTNQQAFRLVVAYSYLSNVYSAILIDLPKESPKIRFAQNYVELINLYDEKEVERGCHMFGVLDESDF